MGPGTRGSAKPAPMTPGPADVRAAPPFFMRPGCTGEPGHGGFSRWGSAQRRVAPRTAWTVWTAWTPCGGRVFGSAMTPSGVVASSHRNPELCPFFRSVRPFKGSGWLPGKFKGSRALLLLRAGRCGWSGDRTSESGFESSYVLPFQSCARSAGESCIRVHDNGLSYRAPRGLGRVAPRCGWA